MHPRGRLALTLCLFAGGLSLGSCSDSSSGNFSQFPGFEEWRASYPPSNAVPDPEAMELAHRFRPRFYLPDGIEGPISFYRDYIAQGFLTLSDGSKKHDVNREDLNQARDDPKAVFRHIPSADPTPRMAVYARVDEAKSPIPGEEPWLFITYTLAFRTSGLPYGLSAGTGALLGLVRNLDDWHQLDNYTAVYLALDASRTPVAVTFQQHNYTRTYLLGLEEGPGVLPRPADGRIPVDVAIRSNELYPHLPGKIRRRAVSFLDEKAVQYLIADGSPPLLSADDITDPVRKIDPPICFLPPSDAFYTFTGWLGRKRLMPGSSGPPGADYNTIPAFKPLHIQLAASHWWEGDTLFPEVFLSASPWDQDLDTVEDYLAPLFERFAQMRSEAQPTLPPITSDPPLVNPDGCPEPGAKGSARRAKDKAGRLFAYSG